MVSKSLQCVVLERTAPLWRLASQPRSWQTLLLALVILAPTLLIVLWLWPKEKYIENGHEWYRVASSVPNHVYAIPVRQGPPLEIKREERQSIIDKCFPADGDVIDASRMLHLIRVCGVDYKIRLKDFESAHTLLDVLTDERLSRLAFGAVPMSITDTGLRYSHIEQLGSINGTWRSTEKHRDQFLASMAEAAVPLDQRIKLRQRELLLRDVLQDSLAQFNLEQQELAWTAFAYAICLPPQKEWFNRFGERYSFDSVVDELLSRSLAKESCFGTHIAFALTVILSRDYDLHILSKPVGERLRERLSSWLAAAIATQSAEGSWDFDWWKLRGEYKKNDSDYDHFVSFSRLLATSHLAEWLLLLPDAFGVPDHTLLAARRYLFMRLMLASRNDVVEQFCPYTHAFRVVLSGSEVMREHHEPQH